MKYNNEKMLYQFTKGREIQWSVDLTEELNCFQCFDAVGWAAGRASVL